MTYESMMAANDPTALYDLWERGRLFSESMTQAEITDWVDDDLMDPRDITVEPV